MAPYKVILQVIIFCHLSWLLAGCSGIKEIQSEIYVTALGMDYTDNKYHLYLQAVGFNNITGSEPDIAKEPAPIVIGHGEGETIQEAMDDIEKHSVNPLYYGHVQAIFISKNILEGQLDGFLDYFSRNYYLRYNTLIYAYDHDIKEIMNVRGLFYKPPNLTFTYDPKEQLFFNTFFPTITVQNIIKRFYEPIGSLMIPTIDVTDNYWDEDSDSKKILTISGAYFLVNQQLKGWLQEEELSGLDWFNKEFHNMKLSIKDKAVSMSIDDIKHTIKIVDGKAPKYDVELDVKASITENPKNLNRKQIAQQTESIIASQIQQTFNKGLEINADVFNLSEKAYRFKSKTWTNEEIKNLTNDSIHQITVNVFVKDGGAVKIIK
ncbi:Ger(x)C family spore germination protein [Lysinibacillus parviboronicapiens]|uniref:Ger(x)C family spore germination protein n=1 Tax=Lysinibacillus parviboronicapiens TaxID=436516 RepID=UPI000D3BBFC5|nr:Ger(x)C family spore germination protein [Lysinibacillus parviboronicapiens]